MVLEIRQFAAIEIPARLEHTVHRHKHFVVHAVVDQLEIEKWYMPRHENRWFLLIFTIKNVLPFISDGRNSHRNTYSIASFACCKSSR